MSEGSTLQETKCSVYLVTNLVSGMKYVGFTARTVQARWREHCKGSKKFKLLTAAIKERGVENFKIDVLFEGPRAESLEAERRFIREYQSIEHGYNRSIGGEYSPSGIVRPPMSMEARNRISKSALGHKRWLGRKHSDEAKAKISAFKRGRKMSDNARANMSRSGKGRKFTEEHCRKISLNNVGFKSRQHSEETRRKMSRAHLGSKAMVGRHLSAETKEKLRVRGLGRKQSEATKEKKRLALAGRQPSETTKAKMKVARDRYLVKCAAERALNWGLV